jgi:hypothetical protein
MRVLAAITALFLFSAPVLAASPVVEAAIKVLQTVAADPVKLKILCTMMDLDDKMGDKEDPAIEAQIDKLADQLGPEFKAAWSAIEAIDENSPDGKVLAAAIDQVDDKCPN